MDHEPGTCFCITCPNFTGATVLTCCQIFFVKIPCAQTFCSHPWRREKGTHQPISKRGLSPSGGIFLPHTLWPVAPESSSGFLTTFSSQPAWDGANRHWWDWEGPGGLLAHHGNSGVSEGLWSPSTTAVILLAPTVGSPAPTVGSPTPTAHSPPCVCGGGSGFRLKSPLLCPTAFHPCSKGKIERGCVKHTDTPRLSPSTDKPPQPIHGTAPSHAWRPTHLFIYVLHHFRCQKFQNKFESLFIIMTLWKKSVTF